LDVLLAATTSGQIVHFKVPFQAGRLLVRQERLWNSHGGQNMATLLSTVSALLFGGSPPTWSHSKKNGVTRCSG